MKKSFDKFFHFIDDLNPSSFIAGNVGGIALLTVLLRIPDVEKYLHNKLSLKILANVLYFLFISLVLSIPILFILKQRRWLSKIWHKSIMLALGVLKRIKHVVVISLGTILAPVIKYALVNKIGEYQREEPFSILSCVKDFEAYYPKNFDLEDEKEIRFKVIPLNGNYWRIGYKLSKDGKFSSLHHSYKCPLIYLTKEPHEKKIKVDYYDENGMHVIMNSVISAGYTGEENIEIIYRKEGDFMEFEAIIDEQSCHKTHIPEEYIYAQLLAWSDRIAHDPHFKIKVIRNR